jgi:malonate-semialdehyde dehydrogenase (acetylating)/methylmalonate-semialdehyde dehydrogenase
MIPMWMFAPALACGNAFILKPSERDPSVPLMLVELLEEAGLPKGVLQVVNGDKEAVDALLDHPVIQSIRLRGLHPDRGIHLFPRLRGRKARPVLRWRERTT